MRRRFGISLVIALFVAAGSPAHAADEVSDGQWFHQLLNVAEAHQITRGEGVTVAVLDTGVEASHPDLAGSVLSGVDLTSLQNAGNQDGNGHGTGMASLIAGHGRVKGIAPAAKILPVRIGVDQGRSDWLAQGVAYAVANGAKVISISFGGVADELKQREISAAIAADVVVVASAGNRPDASGVEFPASHPGVIAVGGLDKAGNHSSVSVSGPQMVIAAPSDGISHATRGGKYSVGTGTSDSAAIVAGAAALIRAKFPDLKAPEVIRRLTATAIDKGPPGRDSDYGYGVLNIVGALTADIAPASPTAPTAKAAPPPGRGRFPWWILYVAIPVVIAANVAVLIITRTLRRR